MTNHSNIKISVVIPVYNAEKTIALCIDSLNNQNYPSELYEIICVDDGSTDSSLSILNSYRSNVSLKIQTQENCGPAVARNNGVRIADGDIIIFTDSDCELEENWVREMASPFEDPKIGGVQGRYKTRQTGLAPLFDQLDIEGRYDKFKNNKNINSIGTYSAAYRKKDFLHVGGFNSSYRTACGEDFELSNKVAELGYDMIFNDKAICYHKHPESFAKYLKVKYIRGYWRALLYKNNKNTIVNDSYSSRIMKIQFIFVILFLLSTVLGFAIDGFQYFSVACIVMYLLLCVPFMRAYCKKNVTVAIVFPFVNFGRALYFSVGLLIGSVHLFLRPYRHT